MHAFLILPKILNRTSQIIGHALCPKRFLLSAKNRQNGAAKVEILPGGDLQQQPENSHTSRFNLQVIDPHSNTIRYKTHTSLEDGVPNELINDLINDNIALKNELEKVISETETLSRKYEEIDTRVKSMNGVCDIVLVDIVKDEKNHKSNQTKDSKVPKKTLLGL